MAMGNAWTGQRNGRARRRLRAFRLLPAGSLGFTLIELLSVVVMLGVLAMVVAPRFMSLGTTLPARVAEIRMSLRFVQLRALKGRDKEWGMSASSTSYWAFNGTDPSDANAYFSLPGEDNSTVSLASKHMTMTPFTVYFDRNGVPYDTSGALTAPLNITIGAEGQTQTITITPVTGFIP